MVCLQFVISHDALNPTGISDPHTEKSSIRAYGIANTAFAVIGLLSDVLVVWRCCVVYREAFLCYFVRVVCWLLYAADLAIGVSSTVTFSTPTEFGHHTPIVLARVALCISASLNIICTALIVGRLYSVKKYFSNMMGSSIQSQIQYTTVSAMLIESCALYATVSLTFLVLWLLSSPFTFLVAVIYGECQIISVFLVILRVSKGIAWSSAVDSDAIADLDLTKN
ncbi:hypothetical protein CONPUDRAFT_159743 [Coniophora puteana RWD-64-598 SS2]|uniref:Uncharacterized protein n=1 Tax=Coniophora puteana (strain RWD-64-598) TaxID=741705 RepID=A0A5M3M6J5_CONPW|nr:uncharacterized protein CONPUDRAFT_159743 [Coniophora puteana RWD-64-598 SS2]EIW74982.1 hypothetical protein CONPUDRAFT_159743 [Coniophora puteana RWD-64-598 SS2]